MIRLYSNDCPKCKVLKIKLKNINIEFEEINNIEVMLSKGFSSAPILEINNTTYGFNEAIKWIGEQGN